MEEIELGLLVGQAKSGRAGAAEEIIRRFAPLKIKLIKKFFGYGCDWDDYLAEGDLLIIESIAEYDPGRNVPFESYLKIRLKYLYQNIRAKKKDIIYLDQTTADGISIADTIESDDPPVEESVLGEAESDEVRAALESLTDKQKTIIELYYYQSKGIKQCADIMGISYQSAVELKGRAVRALAETIKNLL